MSIFRKKIFSRTCAKYVYFLFYTLINFRVEEGYWEFFKYYFLKRKYKIQYIKPRVEYLTIRTQDGVFKCPIFDKWDAVYSINPFTERSLKEEVNIKNRNVIFFDIGAFVGKYTIMLGNIMKRGKNINYKIFGFEPSPISYQLLKENINLNKLVGIVKVYNTALSNRNDILKFMENFSTSRVITNANREVTNNIVLVNSITGDNFLKNEKLDIQEKFILMKIDVEGHEFEVIEGFKETLKISTEGKLIVEILPQSEKKNKIIRLLENLGYFYNKKYGNNYILIKHKSL